MPRPDIAGIEIDQRSGSSESVSIQSDWVTPGGSGEAGWASEGNGHGATRLRAGRSPI